MLPTKAASAYLDQRLLDPTRYHNGSTTSGHYPGWDRHGRVRRQAWIDDDLTTHGTDPDLPNKPPIVELEYQYDAASNRLARIDSRPGASMFNRDYTFDYDELYRVTESKRGVHATGDTALRSQQWELDTLGNWSELRTELTGDGAFTSTDEADTRVHNAANEMTGHSPAFRPNPPYASTYDENGNWLTDKRSTSTTAVYTHDAWDRLVEITIDKATVPASSVTIAKYDYNALNWRIAKESDTTVPIDGLDERREFYYDADWRLLQEEIDNDYIATPGIDEIAQQVWGLSYIDAAAMRRIDAEANGAYDRNYFYLHDANQNVIAILNNTGGLIERIRYDAYGVGRHHWPGDVNGDGAQDSNDQNGVQFVGITDPNYNVDADVNRDGAVSLADATAAANLAGMAYPDTLPLGLISDAGRADNPIGFAGYVFNAEDTNYTVRHRHYQPIHGRWLERDPAGYVDGMNLFEYARGGPATSLDPTGQYELTYEDLYCRLKLPLDVVRMILEEQSSRDKRANEENQHYISLMDTSNFRGIRGGASITANNLTFGALDALGVTDTAQYVGPGFDASRISATVAREAAITAATLGSSALVQAGRGGLALRSANYALRGYESVSAVQGVGASYDSFRSGHYIRGSFEAATGAMAIHGATGRVARITRTSSAPIRSGSATILQRSFAPPAQIHRHHPIAKFLGGRASQRLSKIPAPYHIDFHRQLRRNLKAAGIPLRVGGRGGSTADWARYMQQNPGTQRKALDAALSSSRYIDTKYGTSVTQDLWHNIIYKNYFPYP